MHAAFQLFIFRQLGSKLVALLMVVYDTDIIFNKCYSYSVAFHCCISVELDLQLESAE